MHKQIKIFRYTLFNVYTYYLSQTLNKRKRFVNIQITIGIFSFICYYLQKHISIRFEINKGW